MKVSLCGQRERERERVRERENIRVEPCINTDNRDKQRNLGTESGAGPNGRKAVVEMKYNAQRRGTFYDGKSIIQTNF